MMFSLFLLLPAAEKLLRLIRMLRAPVIGNVDAAANPYALMRLDVVEEALQRDEAAGAAEQTAMHADRQHLGRFFAFLVEHVEAVFQVLEELFAGVETLWRGEAHVVAVERIGHHQMR